MVAHTSLKTPTAVAEFLIGQLQKTENHIINTFSDIRYLVNTKIEKEYRFITQSQNRIKQTLKGWVVQKAHLLDRQKSRLQSTIRLQLLQQKNKLALLEKSIQGHSPSLLLKQGYTLSTINGKRISSMAEVKAGDKIKTFVSDGEFESEVL
jgi:exodeoxyribonuclease VII large subunit